MQPADLGDLVSFLATFFVKNPCGRQKLEFLPSMKSLKVPLLFHPQFSISWAWGSSVAEHAAQTGFGLRTLLLQPLEYCCIWLSLFFIVYIVYSISICWVLPQDTRFLPQISTIPLSQEERLSEFCSGAPAPPAPQNTTSPTTLMAVIIGAHAFRCARCWAVWPVLQASYMCSGQARLQIEEFTLHLRNLLVGRKWMSLLCCVWAWLVIRFQGSFISGAGGGQVLESLFDHKSPKIPGVTGMLESKNSPILPQKIWLRSCSGDSLVLASDPGQTCPQLLNFQRSLQDAMQEVTSWLFWPCGWCPSLVAAEFYQKVQPLHFEKPTIISPTIQNNKKYMAKKCAVNQIKNNWGRTCCSAHVTQGHRQLHSAATLGRCCLHQL